MLLSVSPVHAADATPADKAAPPDKRLKLGPYVDPYGVPVERILDVPHFEERIDVHGKAMDTKSLTARMEWWMRDFEPLRGAVSRAGSAPSLQEIREYRNHEPDTVDMLPVIDWLLGKLNKR